MATTERSIGWATGVASTDGATTYASDRMSAFERAGLGTGILLTGSYLAMTGSATTTLTIADGSAIVGGYFYESNGSVTIATSTLGSATYSIIIIANTAAGNQTVTANGAATTTVVPATTRIALVTAAQLTTITTSITATNFVTLGTVTTSAGTISTITPYYNYATTRQLNVANYAIMAGGVATLLVANTDYQIGTFTSSTTNVDGSIALDTTTGTVTFLTSGYYLVSVQVQFNAGTTGVRKLAITNLLNAYAISPTNFATSALVYLTHAAYIAVTPGSSTAIAITAASTVTGQSVTSCTISVKRV